MPLDEFGQTTSKVRCGHEFDVSYLEEYITKTIPGFQIPLQVSQFKFGQSNPTYLLKDKNEKEYVLRKKPSGALISKTAHAVEREYRILRCLGGTNVPVPKIFALCKDANVIGTPFYIMEFLQGRVFLDASIPSLSVEERKKCWISAIETLAKLHTVDIKTVGLENYGKHTDFYSRQIKSLSKISEIQAQIVNKKTGKTVGSLYKLEELLDWFHKNQPKDRCTIIHGDYKIDNLIFDSKESYVSAILDWELSTIGHPLSDLANLLSFFYYEDVGGFKGFLGNHQFLSHINVKGLIQRYSLLAGFEFSEKEWRFAIVFSFFRAAVIMQGIAARIAQNQSSSSDHSMYSEAFQPTMKFTLDLIRIDELHSSKL